jgi:ankyrin repeat protein
MSIRPSLFLVCAICLISAPIVSCGEIHDAVGRGDLQSVESLITGNRGLLEARDDAGKTPLHRAVESGFPETAKYLISEGADVNARDNKNESPLHLAASSGNVEIAGMLLDKGTTALNDTSIAEKNNAVGKWTPLHLACLNGHPEMVQFLLDQGADIEARDALQRTPLILSAQSSDLKVAEILIQRGADINATAVRGYSALLWGARNRAEGYVDLLVKKKAAIAPEMLSLAFQMAAVAGMEELYAYVLEQKFDVAEIKKRDPELIFPAAAGGSVEIVKSLVGYGFELNQTDAVGWTPLHYAASEGHAGVVEYLAKQGIDLNARNMRGENAFNLASAKSFGEAADCLKANGADTSAPQFPILEGPYMGQNPPGDQPEVFMPGIVSGNDRAHSSITFSPDVTEAYWTEMIPPEGRVAFMRMEGGRWTYPTTANIDRDPSFSPDGKRLYFIKTQPFRAGEVPGGDPDVKEEYWYKERTASGWSEPVSVGDAVNIVGVHWPCSIDKTGNLYFSEFSEKMYYSRYEGGVYQKPILLTELFNNKTLIGRSPFISPEGDYLLFSSNDGLNISFKKKDGSWSDKINLGNVINSSHENGSPRVTADGKYLFFVSAGQSRPWGIYWVSTSFIDRLKAEHLVDN